MPKIEKVEGEKIIELLAIMFSDRQSKGFYVPCKIVEKSTKESINLKLCFLKPVIDLKMLFTKKKLHHVIF